MRCAFILTFVALLVGPVSAEEVADLSAALTSGSWSKIIGNPKMSDRYVYAFAKDGTYKSVLISDFTPRPTTTGRWKLVKTKDGKIHLNLKSKDAQYQWLREDSLIRYNAKKEVLLISGPRYNGEVPLRREKAK